MNKIDRTRILLKRMYLLSIFASSSSSAALSFERPEDVPVKSDVPDAELWSLLLLWKEDSSSLILIFNSGFSVGKGWLRLVLRNTLPSCGVWFGIYEKKKCVVVVVGGGAIIVEKGAKVQLPPTTETTILRGGGRRSDSFIDKGGKILHVKYEMSAKISKR